MAPSTRRRDASATPSTHITTRARSRAPTPSRPLPSLQTKPSHAYGAPGKADLGEQITTSAAQVEDAFDDASRAESEDEMPPPPRVPPPRPGKVVESTKSAQKNLPGAPRPQHHENSGDASEMAHRTEIQGSALYQGRTNLAPDPPARAAASPALSQWMLYTFVFLSLLGTFSSLAVLLRLSLAAAPVPTHAEVANSSFLDFKKYQFNLNYFLLDNFDRLNNTIAVHQEKIDLHDEILRQLQEILPVALEINRTMGMARASHLVRNLEDSMKQVNYFSPGHGALIDPHLTTPTHGHATSLLGKLKWAAGFASFNMPEVYLNPPIAALTSWQESAQCWCSTPQTQLGIRLGHKVYPDKIIVEHIPAGGTLDAKAAPRKLEFWAQLDSVNEAQRIQHLLDKHVHISEAYECGQPPTNQKNWVCLGRNEYDIEHFFYAQEFYLHGYWENIAFTTSRMVVRVNENWGADHTCIYRVRMVGLQGAELPEQVVEVEEEMTREL